MTGTGETADRGAEALVAQYERAGCVRARPAILQPAEPFLDFSGEDIRRRMFLTSDADGHELCLRPDLTIPVSRDYLGSRTAGDALALCYLGTVFRQRADGPAEFLQAGVESFGRTDAAAADAEMVALALEATSHYGLDAPEIRMGDAALFAALLDALALAPAWKRRLVKDFNRAANLAHDLDQLVTAASRAKPEYQGVLAALAGSDPRAAHALVTDLISIAGINAVGGRTVGEIADRFLEQATRGAASLPPPAKELIERFLAVTGNPDEAAADMRALAAEARLDLNAALDLFETRTGFLAARGIAVERLAFATAFGRGFDYYTGMVFELHDPLRRVDRHLVAGGRYDGLLSRLGSPTPIPAVGFAVWIDRLSALGAAA